MASSRAARAWAVAPALFFFLAKFGASAEAKFPPEIDWQTQRTPHFLVHFPPSYSRFAALLAADLEEAYAVLSRDLRWELRAPADIVVRGDVDIPNGLTSVFPLNLIQFQAVPFSPATAIGEYDDWVRTLAYHELTHLIANDSTDGAFALGRTILGSAAKMNQYQPLWIIEGLAVYEETLRSRYGRGRSAFVDMMLRAAASEGLLDSSDERFGITLDRLDAGVPVWPAGQTPYVYGYVMEEMLSDSRGPEAPFAVSAESARWLPFFINRVSEIAAGTDYYAIWDRAVARMKEFAAADLASIRSTPVTTVRRLSSIGRSTGGLALSEDETRAYVVRDSYSEGAGLTEIELASGRARRLSDWLFGGTPQLRRVGGWLVYSRFEPFEEYRSYGDVFLWDLRSGRERRVTVGARASDPDASEDLALEDGRISAGAVAYVKNLDDGNQGIAVRDAGGERVVFRGERFERASGVAWGRGALADWIAFSWKANGAGEQLLALNAKTGAVRALTPVSAVEARENESTPSWTPEGDLLYAGSSGGVFNVFRLGQASVLRALEGPPGGFGTPSRLTNLETGAFFPVLSRSGRLFAVAYGASGFDAAVLSREETSGAPGLATPRSKLRSHEAAHEVAHEVAQAATPTSSLAAAPEPPASESYSPFPSIWPRYWFPFASVVTDGVTLGISTSGNDALSIHSYNLSAAWDSRASFPLYSITYQYDGLYPSIVLSRQQQNQYLGFLQSSNQLDTTSVSVVYPIDFWSVAFGATETESQFLGNASSSGGLQFRLSHSDVRIYPDSIDPDFGESGHRADVTATGYVVGDAQFASLELRAEQRVPSLWDQQFLRFYGTAARSTNRDLTSLYFVGGGETVVSELEDFLVRGYVPGSLYGRSLATFNAEYWLPLKSVFRGRGTLPAFYERAKLKLFVDTGSGEFVGGAPDGFVHWPVGVGAQLLQDVRVLDRLPFTVALGFDWGLNPALGGEKQLVFGVFARMN
jgi:hypothetical protein